MDGARFGRFAATTMVLGLMLSLSVPALGTDLPRVPPGFVVTQYAAVGGAGTSLSFGPDTRDPDAAARLYVADYLNGRVVVVDDIAGIGSDPVVFADGFSSPLGVLAADDGSVYVADSEQGSRPYGPRPYGRVWRVRDTDGDGVADKRNVVVKDLPNGRHNTNNMAFGPDEMLYVTNGNSTDDGIEGGQPEVIPWSGSVIRVNPKARNLSVLDLKKKRNLVATGMRNIYDVAFSPEDPHNLLIPMNGVDDARPAEREGEGEEGRENSDDVLFLADINDRRVTGGPYIEHFGFPSCLYNLERQGNLAPYRNPNPGVIKKFGRCRKSKVERPLATFGLHVSANGLAFQVNESWGADYLNDLFVTEFGNFFGDEVVGHKIVRIEFDHGGTRVTQRSDFTVGGTPLDLTFDRGGNLYVLDFTGDIVKISQL